MSGSIDYNNAEYRDRYEIDDRCDVGKLSGFRSESDGHDWRLISERSTLGRDGEEHWQRRWYCTRCRLVESWTSG